MAVAIMRRRAPGLMAPDTAPDQCRGEDHRAMLEAGVLRHLSERRRGVAGRRWTIFPARDFVMSFGPMGREAILA